MNDPSLKQAPLNDALSAVDTHLRELRDVLEIARHHLDDDGLRVLAREARKRVADTRAGVDWILLDRLGTYDTDVLAALVELEPERGQQFRTTGEQVWNLCKRTSYPAVHVAMRRLAHLGLIDRKVGRGNHGTFIRINWPAEQKAAA